MTFPAYNRFEFHRNGHSNRRDADAKPRVFILAIEDRDVYIHVAGDECQRVADIYDAALDTELVAGLEPQDALRLGVEFERARQRAYGDEGSVE